MDHTADPKTQPWDRREDETELEYHRFRRWLTEDPPRSLVAFAKKLGLATQTIHDVSSRRDWTARTLAWDAHLAPELEAITVEEIKSRRRVHLLRTRAILDVATKRFLEGKGDLSPYHGGKLALDALLKERLILGDATERQDQTLEIVQGDPDPMRLTDEEREEWGALMETPEVGRFLELDDKACGRKADPDEPPGA